MRLGQTPLTVTTFAGEHRIEVVKPGFVRYQLDVVVEPGRGAAHDANLVIEPGVPQSGDQPQPRRASVGQGERSDRPFWRRSRSPLRGHVATVAGRAADRAFATPCCRLLA